MDPQTARTSSIPSKNQDLSEEQMPAKSEFDSTHYDSEIRPTRTTDSPIAKAIRISLEKQEFDGTQSLTKSVPLGTDIVAPLPMNSLTANSSPAQLEKQEFEPKNSLTLFNLPRTDDPRPQRVTSLQKVLILSILCSAQFFDIFNSGSCIIALPSIQRDLKFTSGALQWVVTAYSLTFAAFLLLAGRLSDIYHPKPVFCVGYITVGLFSVLCGVSVHPIMLLVFRALQGIGAAMTLPSAIAMIVQNFPDPKERGRVLGVFGCFGAVGNVAGFIIGGVITSRIGWRWIFYIVGISIVPFSVTAFLVLPTHTMPIRSTRKIDWQGVLALAGGLILFIYAVSDGNETGWNKPQIIVTLIASVVFVVGFFLIERSVEDPAVPPRTWRNENFLPLFFYTWSIYWNIQSIQVQIVQVFQDLFQWSALSAAVHCLPTGLVGLIGSPLTGLLAPYIPRKVLLVGGQLFMLVSIVLFALADTPGKYWSHILPGMITDTIGLALSFVSVNIVIMAGARKGEEGVVGAMMNAGFQLGAAIGIAVTTAISVGVNKKLPDDSLSQFKGYAASFWSLIGLHVSSSFGWSGDIN